MPDNDDLLNSRLWILQLLSQKQLPGIVTRKLKSGDYKIKPLIDNLPLSDGTYVEEFIAFQGDVRVENISEKDYCRFEWKNFGERKKKPTSYGTLEDGDPQAIEVEVISYEDAEKIAFEIREDIGDNLRRQIIEDNKVSQQRIQENWQELNRAFKSLDSYISSYSLDEIQNKLQEIQEQYQQIEDIKASQNKQQEALDKQAKQLEPYRSLLPESEEDEEINKIQLVDLPEKFGHKWKEQLENNGLYVTKQIANSYLISIFSALYLGRLVLLNGTVGVGKTSIIKHSATLLGGKSKIIPVRPAWLDPSDLLGFYDPLQEIFRPAPFLDALNEASKYERRNKNRLHLVCLDELNLAKIENYASDILSQLEYSQQGKEDGLMLYSKNTWENLKEECEHLQQQENPKSKQRLKIIQNLLDNYPKHTFLIPRNLVLLGTLNSDET